MCLILCYTKHDPAKRDELIERAWGHMALSQKDGYGAAWFDAEGNIGFHRRRYPKIKPEEEPMPFVKDKRPVGGFGDSNDIPSDGGFLIIHARGASHGIPITLPNTHPFMDEFGDGSRVALIHNGKVESKKYENELPDCTCDSELLMRAYVDGGINQVEQYIDGKYAMMMLEYGPVPLTGETEEEIAAQEALPFRKTLHIAKDKPQNLCFGQTADKTFVFGTTEYLLTCVGATAKGELKDNILLVFSDATTYEMTEFLPLTWAQKIGFGQRQEVKTQYSYPNDGKPAPVLPDLPGPKSNVLTQLEQDICTAEAEEIKALERAPIEVV